MCEVLRTIWTRRPETGSVKVLTEMRFRAGEVLDHDANDMGGRITIKGTLKGPRAKCWPTLLSLTVRRFGTAGIMLELALKQNMFTIVQSRGQPGYLPQTLECFVEPEEIFERVALATGCPFFRFTRPTVDLSIFDADWARTTFSASPHLPMETIEVPIAARSQAILTTPIMSYRPCTEWRERVYIGPSISDGTFMPAFQGRCSGNCVDCDQHGMLNDDRNGGGQTCFECFYVRTDKQLVTDGVAAMDLDVHPSIFADLPGCLKAKIFNYLPVGPKPKYLLELEGRTFKRNYICDGCKLPTTDRIGCDGCFPTCQVNSYVFVDGETTVPLPRLLDIDKYLDYITNRALPKPTNSADVQKALEGLWSASAVAGSEQTADQFQCACSPGMELGYELSHLKDHIFQIAIKDFLDPWTFNVKQVMKCCVGILVPDGRIIPFCAYNSVRYREEIRNQLVEKKKLDNARKKIRLAEQISSQAPTPADD